MKAIVCTKYGGPDVLRIREITKPSPKRNEVLVKICAFPITTPDRRIRGLIVPFPKSQLILRMFLRVKLGLTKPRNPILGNYLAGKIEAAGKGVTRFHVGEEVIAFSGDQRSAYAEYICLPENSVMVLKPYNLCIEESAAIPYGAFNALCFLKRAGGVKANDKVLIYGASGAIGSSAVQIAKCFGAEVTGICSGANLKLVKSLGADYVIDYTKMKFTDNGIQYDIIFDAVGKITAAKCAESLSKIGKYISVFSSKTQIPTEDIAWLKALVETGKLVPVIDKYYPFEEVALAHRYADGGHVKGNVIIRV